MRNLIIGHNGYIGKKILASINEDQAIFFERKDLDLLNLEKINYCFKKLKNERIRIIYLAAINRTTADTEIAFHKNILMVKNFIEASSKLNIENLVYASTVDVYGDNNNIINEKTLINPKTGYGLSKFCCEQLLRNNAVYPISILRLPGIYGNFPGDKSLIGQFIKLVENDAEICINGNGEILRDYLNLDDLVRILYKILDLNYNGILNIASGKSLSIKKILTLIYKYQNKVEKIKFVKKDSRHFDLRFENSELIELIGDYKFKDLELGIGDYFKVE